MNNLFSNFLLKEIKADTKKILEDPYVSDLLLYRRLVSNAYDPTTGNSTPTYSYVSDINALRGQYSLRDIAASNGALAVGDRFYVFDPSVLSLVPEDDDRILVKLTARGAVKVINGTSAVQSANTYFLTDDVEPDDVLYVGEEFGRIQSVTAETGLVLTAAWSGTSSGLYVQGFAIYREFKLLDWQQDPLNASLKVIVRKAGG